MPYQTVRGVEHFYQWITSDDGDADRTQDHDPDRPVMVFIHGWGGSSRYWECTARSLADRFDCLLYDMRGFGRSSLPAPDRNVAPSFATKPELEQDYALEAYADDLAELLDTLGLDRVSLNAHSMGASVATLFLNRHRDRVDRAILTCSGIFDYDPLTFNLFHAVSRWVVILRPRWMAAIAGLEGMFMQRFLHRDIPIQDKRDFLTDFVMADFDAALGTIYTSVSKHAATIMPHEFARVNVPTLLIAGEHDIIIPAAMGERAAKLSSAIDYCEIPDTAHFPMLEDSSTYRAAIANFLR
jgi:proline iminopeptidase